MSPRGHIAAWNGQCPKTRYDEQMEEGGKSKKRCQIVLPVKICVCDKEQIKELQCLLGEF